MEDVEVASGAGGAARKRRRVIPIIDSRFQWKYTLLIVALGVGVTAIMGGFLFKAHQDNTRLLELDPSLQEQVIRGDQIFLLYLIITVIAMALMLSIWGLVVTHRISGPLHLVARYLDVIAEGQYPDMRPLRKRDELQAFFSAFEDAVATLRGRDEATHDELSALIEQAKKGDADVDSVVRALEKRCAVLADALGR